MLTSGGRGYIFDLRDDTFTPITAEHFPQNVIACAYIQTYFLVLAANSRRLRRPARRRPVGPRPRCANLRRTLASGRAPAMRQMGTVLGRQPNPTQQPRLVLGDDEGCFAAALDAVRRHASEMVA